MKSEARTMLIRAGERTASLGAHTEARSRFEEAAALTEEPLLRADLLERAGIAAAGNGELGVAMDRFAESVSLFEAEASIHAAARVSARLGEAMWTSGRVEESVALMERAFEVVSREPPDADLASLAAQLGRVLYFAGKTDLAAERIEVALDTAESLWLPGVLSDALNTKSLTLLARGRPQECLALLEYALQVALENDVPSAALRAYYNLGELSLQFDRFEDARDYVRKGVALARRVGDRLWERRTIGQTYPLVALGEWDEAIASMEDSTETDISEDRGAFLALLGDLPFIELARGRRTEAWEHYEKFAQAGISADVQERAMHAVGHAMLLHHEGREAEALVTVEEALASADELGRGAQAFREGFVIAVEAALALGEVERAERTIDELDRIPPGKVPPWLRAQKDRLRARIEGLGSNPANVETRFKRAAATFREISTPFQLAVTLLEHGEWLIGIGRADDAEVLVTEAREIFERLEAKPWADRAGQATGSRVEAGVAS